MRALLVDDDAQLRQAVGWMLRDAGFTGIVEAADGEEALIHLRNGPFDLVITDGQMPRMDGFTLSRALRFRGVSAPIVMLSSRDHAQITHAARQAGVTVHVRKPLDAATLLEAIHGCLAPAAGTGLAAQPA